MGIERQVSHGWTNLVMHRLVAGIGGLKSVLDYYQSPYPGTRNCLKGKSIVGEYMFWKYEQCDSIRLL